MLISCSYNSLEFVLLSKKVVSWLRTRSRDKESRNKCSYFWKGIKNIPDLEFTWWLSGEEPAGQCSGHGFDP